MATTTKQQTTKTTTTTTERRNKCSFIITGFGPFRGVPNNPTMTLVRRLQHAAAAGSNSNSSNSNSKSNGGTRNLTILETHILETSSMVVQKELDDIYSRLSSKNNRVTTTAKPSSTTISSSATISASSTTSSSTETMQSNNIIIVLHLGVNYRGTQFQLEQCAYNDATFRIPDERGYMPQGKCVLGDSNGGSSSTAIISSGDEIEIHGDEGGETTATATTTTTAATTTTRKKEKENNKKENVHKFGKCFQTTLDLKSICGELQSQQKQKQKQTQYKDKDEDEKPPPGVVVSRDPGRFVCNYTYCISLEKCCSFSSSSKSSSSSSKTNHDDHGGGGGDDDDDNGVILPKSLFVHVPPFHVVSEDVQFEFILDIMEAIEKECTTV